jgi:hypothetical protein
VTPPPPRIRLVCGLGIAAANILIDLTVSRRQEFKKARTAFRAWQRFSESGLPRVPECFLQT